MALIVDGSWHSFDESVLMIICTIINYTIVPRTNDGKYISIRVRALIGDQHVSLE